MTYFRGAETQQDGEHCHLVVEPAIVGDGTDEANDIIDNRARVRRSTNSESHRVNPRPIVICAVIPGVCVSAPFSIQIRL